MIRIGVPSKGRLMENTFAWFGARGLAMNRSGADRTYAGQISGSDQAELVMLSAAEMPGELAAGRVHMGVTGSDLVQEGLSDWQDQVQVIAPLGFGRADLVIAVPMVWVDVESIDDLDAVAAQFRAAHGHRLRIATKYHRLTHQFLRHHGVADYQLVDSQGATEGSVKNQTAEAIADITSSGDTLRDNHLKALGDGLILRSEATLFASSHSSLVADSLAMAAFVSHFGLHN